MWRKVFGANTTFKTISSIFSLEQASESQEGLLKYRFLGPVPKLMIQVRICICNQFSGDGEAAGPGNPFSTMALVSDNEHLISILDISKLCLAADLINALIQLLSG